MLRLDMPVRVDIPSLLERIGKRVENFEQLEQEDTEKYVLAHVAFSSGFTPRLLIHDLTDFLYIPDKEEGLNLSISYLIFKPIAERLIEETNAVTPV